MIFLKVKITLTLKREMPLVSTEFKGVVSRIEIDRSSETFYVQVDLINPCDETLHSVENNALIFQSTLNSCIFERIQIHDFVFFSKGKYNYYKKNNLFKTIVDYDKIELKPFFSIGFTQEKFKDLLREIFPQKIYPSFNNDKINDIFIFFTEYLQSVLFPKRDHQENIFDFLSQLSYKNEFNKNDSNKVFWKKFFSNSNFQTDEEVKGLEFSNKISKLTKIYLKNEKGKSTVKYSMITPVHVNKILKEIKNKFLIRNFFLLGLSRFDIIKCFKSKKNDFLTSYSAKSLCNFCKIDSNNDKNEKRNLSENLDLTDWCVYCNSFNTLPIIKNEDNNGIQNVLRCFMRNPFIFLRKSSDSIEKANTIFENTHSVDFSKDRKEILKKCAIILDKLETKIDTYCLRFSEKIQPTVYNFVVKYKDLLCRVYGIKFLENKTEKNVVYLYSNDKFEIEKRIANFIRTCRVNPYSEGIIENIEKYISISKKNENTCLIVTGSPGTGKTTLIKKIADILKGRKESFVLSSFTGKAVCRIKEQTGSKKAFTLDYLLATRNSNYDYMIIDEASMIHSQIFYNILKMRKFSPLKLILVGDENQLPPIKWGQIFNSFLYNLNKSNIFILTKVYRQVKNNNTKDILDFIINFHTNEKIDPEDKYENVEIYRGIKSLSSLTYTLYEIMEVYEDIEEFFDNVKIIGAYNKDVYNLNKIIRNKYNSKFDLENFESKDLIALKKNIYYSLEYKGNENEEETRELIPNGELGRIIEIEDKNSCEKILKIQFKNKSEPVYFGESENLEENIYSKYNLTFAYALTVHKMQGSESDTIIFYVPTFFNEIANNFLTKSLFYTAISRAKTKLILIFQSSNPYEDMEKFAKNKHKKRIDNIEYRIKNSI